MNTHLRSLTRTEYRTLLRRLREARRADVLERASMPILASTYRMRGLSAFEGHETAAVRQTPRELVDLFRNRFLRFPTDRAVRIAAKAESARARRRRSAVLADAVARSRAYADALEAA